jgi:hypothetical protein
MAHTNGKRGLANGATPEPVRPAQAEDDKCLNLLARTAWTLWAAFLKSVIFIGPSDTGR